MKQNYIFTLLLFLFSFYTEKHQIAATYEDVITGSLPGVSFTFTNTTTKLFATILDSKNYKQILTTKLFYR